MTDNQFDNFVRATLRDHSAPVPAGLWDKVNPKQDDDDRKGFILPRKYRNGLLLGLLLLSSAVTGYLLLNNTPTGESNNTNAVAQTAPGNEQLPSKPNNELTGTTVNDEKDEQITTPDNATPSTVNANKETSSTSNSSTNTTAAKPRIGSQDRTAEQNSMMVSSYTAKQPVSKKYNTAGLALKSADEFTDKTNSEQQTATTKEEVLEEVMPDEQTSMQKWERGSLVFSRLNYRPSAMAGPASINGAYANKVKNMIICPPYSRGNTDWFAEFYVSPDVAFRSVQNNTASQQYMQRKDSSERMQLGYSAGVRIVKPITDNFLVRAGLQYTQMNEKFTYRTENEVRTTTVISVRTIVRAPGDTVRITDTSTVQQVGYKNNSIRNRYRSFDIPVTVGYQFGNDNLKIGLNAGVIFNISSWYQGVILDSSLAAVPVSKGNNGIYKNSVGLGLYGGISILKPIGENTQLFFEPYFRYNLNNITNNQAPYQQKFSLGGLSIGLRYNLNR